MNQNENSRKIAEVSRTIKMSESYLDIKVEEGEVYHGHIYLESPNPQEEISGSVYSTNDKLLPEFESFHGTKIDIPFYFKGKLSSRGTFFVGDLVFITNMGEYNIPYHIQVMESMMDSSEGKINKLDQFAELYEKDSAEAVKLFFLPNFSKVFLKDDVILRHLYKSLQKGRKKAYIVEEFLVSAGYKKPVKLAVEPEKIVLDSGKESATITIRMEQPGYVEGEITTAKGQANLSVSSFTSEDFEENVIKVVVEENPNQIVGSDTVKIVTPRQIFEIPVEWWGTLPVHTQDSENRQRVKKARADLMNNYLSFRTGSIGIDDFTQDTLNILEDLVFLTQEPEWKLYRIHVLIMKEKMERVKELFAELDPDRMQVQATELQYNYYLYLRALYLKNAEAISQAVISIREQYESSDDKAENLWLLMNLDREYVYNKKLQYDSIKALFEAGSNSCLLYFEACDLLNDEPSFMEELGTFEMSVFRWGLRYGYVSMALAQQFARMALKIKFFRKAIFYTALKLYKVEADDRFLTLICSLLIKGNMTAHKYHDYFKAGVEKNLKLVGINEFYIRSMDFDAYEEIPQRVLLYFTYSSSLDSVERAYFYVNLLKNKELYQEVMGAYESKILPFTLEQLIRGHINEQLAYLYRYYLNEILKRPEYAKPLCNVMFYQDLRCNNPNMIGVYASYPETGKEKYYPISSGRVKVEIYNERTRLYFVNKYDQRFNKAIDYELTPFMDLDKIPKEWIDENQNDSKLMIMQSVYVDETIEEESLYLAKKIYSETTYEPWLRERAIEALLLYYGNHGNIKELRKWLERTDYSEITVPFRGKLMSYYLMADLIENAFFGVELYGSQSVKQELRLKIAEFGVDYYHGEKDETTLSLCYDGILTKYYSDKTLEYLMQHFEGETIDYLMLWDRSRQSNLDTEKLEEKIITQCIYTGNHSESVARVFENYYIDNKDSELILDYLRFVAGDEYTKEDLPYSVEKIIGREILNGRITSQKAKIHFLYYYAIFKNLQESEQKVIAFIMEELLKEEIYLPIYHQYKEIISLPVEYKEKSFLTYLGETGKKVTLFYSLEGKYDNVQEKVLKEVIPGRYVCSLCFFQNDRVNYYIEEDGNKVEDTAKYQFETFPYENEESRFFTLNRMSENNYDADELENYLKTAYITQEYMKLL